MSCSRLFISAPSPLHDLKVDAHDEEAALQAAGHDVDTPRTPAFCSQSRGKTRGPDEAARRLDAHHGDAETAHLLEREGGVDLREVLDRGQHGGEDPEEVCPRLEGARVHQDEVERENECDDPVHEADDGHDQRRTYRRSFRALGRVQARRGRPRVEDEEEEETDEQVSGHGTGGMEPGARFTWR